MEYRGFIKKLDVRSGFTVPTTLTYDDVVARVISRADLTEDVKGINASIEIIRRTRGGRWPSEAITDTRAPPRRSSGVPGSARAWCSRLGYLSTVAKRRAGASPSTPG
jgi:hypothetical protein